MMHTAIVGVGSNIRPRINVKKAADLLAKHHRLIKRSKFVRTKPIGFRAQSDFLNGALLVQTHARFSDFRRQLKAVERKLGRKPQKNKFGPRTIDLDIVVWDRRIVDKDFYKRAFLRKAVLSLLPRLTAKRTTT